ncbi:hypothetical protein HID58_081047 [Brassica napus]|uniref:Lactoylglutathione lyase n=1 Tax=Brassica napus TaxID=3708 RepID=A0ABQ7Y6N9_BRANA|nr:hypothetical protein HID58_081047 [Brassica napus]
MALRCLPIWVCPQTPHRYPLVGRRVSLWECSSSPSAASQRAVTAVEGNGPELKKASDEMGLVQEAKPVAFHRDLSMLPKPLSANSLYSSAGDDSKVRISFQGIPGAYSETAALEAYPNCETVPCEHFETAFQAAELWLVDKAVLPIENSVGGSIHRNYDLLLRHRLHIVQEVHLPVNHCLLGVPGVNKEEIKRVLSHPQALDQCVNSLNDLGIQRLSAKDTATAAQTVASSGKKDVGAIASVRAANIYGLDILAENIQDDANNVTRFLILSREPMIPRTDRPYKTSIVFSLEEGPGVLFKALAVFALRSINLSKIESRPQRRRPLRVVDGSNNGSAKSFDYLFYIDFEASMAEIRAQHALGHLQEFTSFIRVLGKMAENADLVEWPKKDKRRFLHVVYRVGDLDRTIQFYTECFGMKVLRKRDVPEEKYSNAFLGFGPETSNFVVELTYNYGVSSYDIGTGFGHFAISTQDVSKMVEAVRAKGGNVTREPGPVKGGGSVIAFVKDPDGYTFELIQRGPTPEPLCQVMLRVGDLDRAIKFYEKALGMRLLRRIERPEYKYTIGMMGYAEEYESIVLELTYNYGVTEYTKGNAYAQSNDDDGLQWIKCQSKRMSTRLQLPRKLYHKRVQRYGAKVSWRSLFEIISESKGYGESISSGSPPSLKKKKDKAWQSESSSRNLEEAPEANTKSQSLGGSLWQLGQSITRRLAQSDKKPLSPRRYFASGADLKKTALYDFHVAHGGKMVPFAGWSMPIQYKDSIIDSTVNCRVNGSLFDVAHMCGLSLKGKDCVPFLETLVVADVAGLAPGTGSLTVFTNEKGGAIDDSVITKVTDEHIYLVVNAGCRDKDLAHIEEHMKAFKSKGGDVSWHIHDERSLLALQGPLAAPVLQHLTKEDLSKLYFGQFQILDINGSTCFLTRTGYTGEDGFEISVPSEHAVDLAKAILEKSEGKVRLTGLGARDSLRLEAGLCLYGNDMEQHITPVEAGLTWAIGKRRRADGGFLGADVILKQLQDGPTIRRVGFFSSGPPARSHSEVHDENGNKIGEITSGGFSPNLKKNVAMGYVKSGQHKNGTKVKILVRGKPYEGNITKMPFVATKYYKPS